MSDFLLLLMKNKSYRIDYKHLTNVAQSFTYHSLDLDKIRPNIYLNDCLPFYGLGQFATIVPWT